MEIDGADSSKLALKPGSNAVLGRGSGFNTADRTVSRHHVVLKLEEPQESPRVSFEVTGKNPVWVRSKTSGEVKVFKRSQKGEVEDGDWLCISGRIPVWFAVRKRDEENGKEVKRDLGSESGGESVDIDDIDPVKEFGFLVMGHEFDQYPNQRIRNVKNWDWFLEESRKGKDSEEDDDEADAVEKMRREGKGRKRRKGDADDDDHDWTGDSEDDKEVIAKGRKVRLVAYSTRSKDRDKSKNGGGKDGSSVQKKTVIAREEDDETLGGFIVKEDEDDEELEEESELDEEEEEDFEDDDDD